MAKRNEQLTPAQEQLINQVVTAIFIKPEGYAARLREKGVSLLESEAIGIATISSIQRELELLGVRGDDRRALATTITGRIRQGEYNRLFPITSRISIVYDQESQIYRRSDIGTGSAHERLLEYEKALNEEVDLVRAQREIKRPNSRNNENVMQKPSITRVHVVATFSPDEVDTKVAEVGKFMTKKTIFEQIPMTFEDYEGLERAFIPVSDLEKIVSEGLRSEEFEQVLKSLRRSIVARAFGYEDYSSRMANHILEYVKEKLAPGKKEYALPVIVPRLIAEMLTKELIKNNQLENVEIAEHISQFPEAKPSYTRDLMNIWNNRSTEVTEDPSNITEQYTGNLARELFSDELLSQVLLAECLGIVYPAVYHYQNDRAEVALMATRYLAEQFTMDEIRQLLSPAEDHSSSTSGQDIEEIKQQIREKDLEIAKLKAPTPEIRRRKKQAEEEKIVLVKNLSKAVAQFKNKGSRGSLVRERLNKAVINLIPANNPNPKDYTQGQRSEGYLDAISRFSKRPVTDPNRLPPQSEDYLDGENSFGYIRDFDCRECFHFLNPQLNAAIKHSLRLRKSMVGTR